MTLIVGAAQQTIIDVLRPAVDPAFKALTGADISWVSGDAPGNLAKLLASRGAQQPFDVVFLDNVTQAQAIQAGVVQKINPSDVPGSADIPAGTYANPGYGPPWILIRLGNCVNTEQYKANNIALPTGIEGWFDPKLANRITLPAPANPLWAAEIPGIADHFGVAYDNPQAMMTRFATIKPLSLYTSSGAAQSDMQSGKAWLTTITDGRCLALKLEGKPVELLPLNLKVNGKTYEWINFVDTWDIPVGVNSQKTALAKQFIGVVNGDAFMPVVKKFGYIPSSTKLLAEAQKVPELKGLIPSTFDANAAYSPDHLKFLPRQQAWVDAWNRTFQK